MSTRKPRRSWKTSAAGVGAVVFGAIAAGGLDPLTTKIATIGAAICTGLGFLAARDNGVTSADVAATTKKDPQP